MALATDLRDPYSIPEDLIALLLAEQKESVAGAHLTENIGRLKAHRVAQVPAVNNDAAADDW